MCLFPGSNKAALRLQPWLRQGKGGFPTLLLRSASKGQATDELEMKLEPLQKEVWCVETDSTSWGLTSFGGSPPGSGISRRWAWGVFEAPRPAQPASSWLKFQLCSSRSALTDPLTLVTWEGEKAKRSPLGELHSCTVNSHFQQRLRLCWLQALSWLWLSEHLFPGGARNSSAIKSAKGQGST